MCLYGSISMAERLVGYVPGGNCIVLEFGASGKVVLTFLVYLSGLLGGQIGRAHV